MKPEKAKELLRMWVENQIDTSVCFIGGMGIGKSYIPKELAKELKIGYDGIFPSQMGDGSEMTGIPYREDNVQKWSVPENLPSNNHNYKCRLCLYDNIKHTHERGFYVIDELNTAPIDIRNAMMEFLLSGSIHRNKIQNGWVKVVCMNPETDGFQVESLSKALLRRMVLIKMEPDYNCWRKWGEKFVDKDILKFLDHNRKMLFKEEKFDIQAEFNPDSYRILTEIKTKLLWDELEEPIKFEIIQGICGKEVSAQLLTFLKTEIKPMTAEELFSNYETNVNIFINQRNDLLSVSIEDVLENINKTSRMTKEKAIQICDFVEKISTEAQVIFFNKLEPEALSKIHKNSCTRKTTDEKNEENKPMDEIIGKIKQFIVKNPDNPYNKIQKVRIKLHELQKELETKEVK